MFIYVYVYIYVRDCLRHTGPLSCLQYSHRVVILWLTHRPGRPIVSHVRRVFFFFFFNALTYFACVHLALMAVSADAF